MTDDITQQWNKISKTAIESMKELGSINTRVIEKLTEQQLAVLNTCIEASQKEIEMASSGKNAQSQQTLLKAQADLIAEYNGRLMSIVQSTGDILKDCNSEITSWADKGMSVAQKPAVKTAPKAKAVKKTTKKGRKSFDMDKVGVEAPEGVNPQDATQTIVEKSKGESTPAEIAPKVATDSTSDRVSVDVEVSQDQVDTVERLLKIVLDHAP